jgi:hypothetical protein
MKRLISVAVLVGAFSIAAVGSATAGPKAQGGNGYKASGVGQTATWKFGFNAQGSGCTSAKGELEIKDVETGDTDFHGNVTGIVAYPATGVAVVVGELDKGVSAPTYFKLVVEDNLEPGDGDQMDFLWSTDPFACDELDPAADVLSGNIQVKA